MSNFCSCYNKSHTPKHRFTPLNSVWKTRYRDAISSDWWWLLPSLVALQWYSHNRSIAAVLLKTRLQHRHILWFFWCSSCWSQQLVGNVRTGGGCKPYPGGIGLFSGGAFASSHDRSTFRSLLQVSAWDWWLVNVTTRNDSKPRIISSHHEVLQNYKWVLNLRRTVVTKLASDSGWFLLKVGNGFLFSSCAISLLHCMFYDLSHRSD